MDCALAAKPSRRRTERADTARPVGSRSPSVVIEAALTALATQDDFGPWLASPWGVLADLDPELLAQMEF